MTTNDAEDKKRLDIKDWVKIVGVIASILVASTSLLSASGNVPSLWFDFSLIFLILLIFSVPSMIFAKPISKRFKSWKTGRRQDAIAQKHFKELRDLVYVSKRFNSDIRNIGADLKRFYPNDVNTSLADHTLESYNESVIRNTFFEIERMLEESNKNFRDIYLIMRCFNFCLGNYTSYLKILEVFAHQIMSTQGKPIAKGIEAKFESFREKYNYFVKDFKDYCRRVNEELGEHQFPEWSIEYVEKW